MRVQLEYWETIIVPHSVSSLVINFFAHIYRYDSVPCQVFKMLKEQEIGEKCGLQLNGFNVCQRSFRLLLGVGKSRMVRLRRAILDGSPNCPVDLRFTPNKHVKPPCIIRAKVHEWLVGVYHKLAEPLPEGVQDLPTEGDNRWGKIKRRGKRPRHLVKQQPEASGHHSDVKFLPPGTILSYLDLCRAELGCKISRKIFCRVS